MPEPVFVVFGSASDHAIYVPIVQSLKEKKILSSMHILSAHRSPKELKRAVSKSKAKIFVTGAGLSNALSGVVASQTIKPVIGVPCAGAFGGMDSFLATVQIPPGVCVLSVGFPNAAIDAAFHAANAVSGFEKIVLVKRLENETEEFEKKAEQKLLELKAPFSTEKETTYLDKKSIYIDCVPLEEISSMKKTDSTVIVVPVKKNSLPSDAVQFFEGAKNHLFVGVNRAENAAIGAVQLLGKKNLEKEILSDRKKQKKKVLEADKLESKKLGKS